MIPHRPLLCLAFAILTGCASHSSTPTAPSPSQSHGHGQFLLSGAVAHPGWQPLQNGQTVSQTLHQVQYLGANPNSSTVVLIRHGPDGKTRELINVSSAGQLMDAKQDYTLRDGDELMIPGPGTGPGDLPTEQPHP